MKKNIILILIGLISISENSFALNQQQELTNKISSMASIMTMLVLGFSVLMIMYSGMKYVMAQGDERATEQAKMQIISAGVGIFIALAGNLVLKVLTNVTKTEETTKVTKAVEKGHESGFPVWILVVFASIMLALPLFKVILKATEIKQGEKLGKEDEEIKQTNESIEEETELINKEEKSPFEIIDEKEIKEKIEEILTMIHGLEEELEGLSVDKKHTIYLLEVDLNKLINSYVEINDENKNTYKEKIKEQLETMKLHLQRIYDRVEDEKVHEVEKMVRLINERYKK